MRMTAEEFVELERPSPRVALLGIGYDGSSSYRRGAANAPPVIREALWSEAGNSWTEEGRDLRAGGFEDDGDLVFGEGESAENVREMIEDALGLIGASGRRPLVLGGDHSITYPALRGFRPHHPRLAVLHLDAHPTCTTSSRAIDTPMPALSHGSWRRGSQTGWCRWGFER
jgi:arginase family enzyme